MAMLAEKKTKPSWVLNPRQSDWSKDQNKLGQKMLEKMGWSAGKGLGAKEQGPVDAIRVPYKGDSRGLGAAREKEQAIWLQQQQSFSSLLQELNGDDAQPVEVTSLEEKSKTAKKRVHYQKFTRGKDISRYSKKDLSCIVGPVDTVFKVNSTNEREPVQSESNQVDVTEEGKSQPKQLEVDQIVEEPTQDEEVDRKLRKRSKKKLPADDDRSSEDIVGCSSDKVDEAKKKKSKDKKNREPELPKSRVKSKKRDTNEKNEVTNAESVESSTKERTKRNCTTKEEEPIKKEAAKKKVKNSVSSKDSKEIASCNEEKIKGLKKKRKEKKSRAVKEDDEEIGKSKKEKTEKQDKHEKPRESSVNTPTQDENLSEDDDTSSSLNSALKYLKRKPRDGETIKVPKRFFDNHILNESEETDEDEDRTGIPGKKKKTK
ncbi:G-patch domain [Nesidiocoris tenuis]|uniref:G-patch domain n=1 Tax=Nesidiocoris tenuis TaxID=355587 RepID=A0ABN7ATX7_9HEMI|nr:G-patch domain [Nesidiocoris tenuis]